MGNSAVSIDGVWKYFRLYHEKNQYLKSTLLQGRRSRYDEFWALKDVSFEIPEGSTFGIIGSNGSGKSTLLKCLAGILTPDKGTLKVNGRVSALLELGAGFHPDLTGRENVYLNGAILGMTNREITQKFDDIVDFAGLGQFIDTPVKNYSSGMTVRLGFAIAINVDPEILIIDEVLAVGDESFQKRCFEKIETFRKDGRTILFVSHGLTQVTQLCTSAVWLDHGTVKVIGPTYDVVSRYSGVSHAARPKVNSQEIGERWGTGEAEITSVQLLNSNHEVVQGFETNKPSILRIFYSCQSPINEMVFGVRITHLHGTIVWGSNTKRMGHMIPTLSGNGYIDLEIQKLPLLEGSYDLTIAMSDLSEVHEYDHWDRRIRFNVSQKVNFDEGLVAFHAQWSMTQPCDPRLESLPD
jgi:ABC-type polysaccharide/polyol phosphate transport system ATPase subunit